MRHPVRYFQFIKVFFVHVSVQHKQFLLHTVRLFPRRGVISFQYTSSGVSISTCSGDDENDDEDVAMATMNIRREL